MQEKWLMVKCLLGQSVSTSSRLQEPLESIFA